MDPVAVLVAALAGFAIGLLRSGARPGRRVRVAGPKEEAVDAATPGPHLVSFAMIVLVAGMMRYVFTLSAVDTILEGLAAGLAIGAFLISPWLILTAACERRPGRTGVRDAGFVTFVCGVMGTVLILLT